MRLRPGLNFNFAVLELDAMLLELFKRDPQHPFILSRSTRSRLLPGAKPQ